MSVVGWITVGGGCGDSRGYCLLCVVFVVVLPILRIEIPLVFGRGAWAGEDGRMLRDITWA